MPTNITQTVLASNQQQQPPLPSSIITSFLGMQMARQNGDVVGRQAELDKFKLAIEKEALTQRERHARERHSLITKNIELLKKNAALDQGKEITQRMLSAIDSGDTNTYNMLAPILRDINPEVFQWVTANAQERAGLAKVDPNVQRHAMLPDTATDKERMGVLSGAEIQPLREEQLFKFLQSHRQMLGMSDAEIQEVFDAYRSASFQEKLLITQQMLQAWDERKDQIPAEIYDLGRLQIMTGEGDPRQRQTAGSLPSATDTAQSSLRGDTLQAFNQITTGMTKDARENFASTSIS